jgi:hypothetical protein
MLRTLRITVPLYHFAAGFFFLREESIPFLIKQSINILCYNGPKNVQCRFTAQLLFHPPVGCTVQNLSFDNTI